MSDSKVTFGDGVEREFRFSLKTVMVLDEKHGLDFFEERKSLEGLDAESLKDPKNALKSTKSTVQIVWFGLLANHPEMTKFEAADLIPLGDEELAREIGDALNAAVQRDMPTLMQQQVLSDGDGSGKKEKAEKSD